MKEIRVSAKEIAETLFGSGSLANERTVLLRQQEGIEIHQFWQGKYLESDTREVFVKHDLEFDDIRLFVIGRIDGIVFRNGEIMLEEIKSTRTDLDTLDESTFPSHLAQARLYAYMYCLEKGLKRLTILLTYIEVETREVIQFEKNYTIGRLRAFFLATTGKYLEWIKLLDSHESKRQKSIEGLVFPFPEYRLFQREMMAYVYRNILENGILYVIAPTGIGKTIATIFSALKAINAPRQKIFYLSAKNDGKEIAIDTIRLLEKNGLIAKTCEITAKDQMCFLKERDCDPDICKYANGYYRRVYKAILDIFTNESLLTKDRIREYARKHRICPFEFSLDLSNYCDILVCDYNYAFDPRVHLTRYFEEDIARPILLVDEAHNLVSRSREMYSATVTDKMFSELGKLTRYLKPSPTREISRLRDLFEEFGLELLEVDFIMQEKTNDYLLQLLKRLLGKLDQMLATQKKIKNRGQIMEIYFSVFQFVRISEFYNEEFVFLLERTEDALSASIKCLNAGRFILDTIKNHTEACIFFSATLEPIDYYKNLLTRKEGLDVRMPSPFKRDNLLLLAAEHVSTRYKDRNSSIPDIVKIAKALVSGRKGNYILFFPSYEYMRMVEEKLDFASDKFEVIRQTRSMTIEARSSAIRMFKTETEKTQVGLFVMGGIFGESIDLIGDMLLGVMIVGVGLPALSPFNNILRSHFDVEFKQGFDYAYTYPGINKVIQAVGRVIRTATDRGIAILVDDRFVSSRYLNLYPKEWNHLKTCGNPDEVVSEIAKFWSGK